LVAYKVPKTKSYPVVIKNGDVVSFTRACAKTTYKDMAMARLYGGDNASLIRMIKDQGTEKNVRIQICMLIANLQDFLNLHSERKISDAIIQEVANTIIDNYPNIYLSDIANTFSRVKSGQSGEKILTLSGAMICGWINDAWEKILKEAEELRLLEHDATKKHIR
jgi:hypothetical protein